MFENYEKNLSYKYFEKIGDYSKKKRASELKFFCEKITRKKTRTFEIIKDSDRETGEDLKKLQDKPNAILYQMY